MTEIKTALAWALTTLYKDPADARFDAEILLCFLLKKNRAYLFTYPEHGLSEDQLSKFKQLVLDRAKGIPIAYLTGEREFWSLPLKVNQHTLIPRHETERLVELALELLPAHAPLKVLDLGTGSGTIALALASERPEWQICACDKSKDALKVAEDNAKQLSLKNINFYVSDWFNSLPPDTYHAIISNPPYLAKNDPHLQEGDLRFEPLSALISEQEGLADIQAIAKQGYNYLLPEGLILLEHGYEQKYAIRAILNELGYGQVQCWQDISDQDRVSGGWKQK